MNNAEHKYSSLCIYRKEGIELTELHRSEGVLLVSSSGGHRILARVRKVGFQKMLTRFPRFLVSDFPDFCPPIFPIFVFRFPKYLFSFFSFLFRVGRNFYDESESFNRNLIFKEKMCYDEYYVVNGELDSDPI